MSTISSSRLRQELVQRRIQQCGSSPANPSIARNTPIKSARCMGSSFFSAVRRSFSLSARIMARMCGMRSSAKNMCSVRHSPMPSAPNASRLYRVPGNVGVRAYFDFAERLGPAHEFLQFLDRQATAPAYSAFP